MSHRKWRKSWNINFLESCLDEWETDPNFENQSTEEEQRWGKGVDRGAAIEYDEKISHNCSK